MTNQPDDPVDFGSFRVGRGQPLLLIAGPCVLEESNALMIAKALKTIHEVLSKDGFEFNLVFKGSFDKANRTSITTPRGPGLERGLEILGQVRHETGLLVTTDIHESCQAPAVGKVCDIIQIPAFLARQTDLLVAAAKTGRIVNVKKGQFMSPQDMKNVVGKLLESDCRRILLTERGTFFGYGQLVNDFRSLVVMRQFGVPVVFDATHSVQQPGGAGDRSGGNREFVRPLARAAIAVGIDALFLETHPDPEKSPSDGPNMIPLGEIENLLKDLLQLRKSSTFC
ncbi:MAG: 3-deoxy-8-phosphooctulonate synthase [Thermoguttaceae bacterium]|nr:3-deoxy-8-phosphooctulonate synthase [Thermoguttaceae bacterium]